MNIILIGAQGSGKGTQAKMLSRRYKIPHISTGDILRNMPNDTKLGNKVHELMESGTMVPDDIMLDIVDKRLSEPDCNNGWILDGFPRTIVQAEGLKAKPDYVIFINLSDTQAVQRISGRRQCRACATVYGTEAPPKQEGVCDKCGGELYQRDDDKPEAVAKRLEMFHTETEPLKEFYKEQGTLQVVDGDMPIEDVFETILGIVSE